MDDKKVSALLFAMSDSATAIAAALAVKEIQAAEDARVIAELERLAAARKAAGLLVQRQRVDETEARYRQLVAKYGSNRAGRRRARAEANAEARKKR